MKSDSEELRRQIDRDPRMQKIESDFKRGAEERERARREKFDSNAEVQRRKAMSADEKSRDAVDRMTQNIKERNDYFSGRDTTESAARKEAERIANLADRKRK